MGAPQRLGSVFARGDRGLATDRTAPNALPARPEVGAVRLIFTASDALPFAHTYIGGMTELTVWFDGNCPLCLREIALMRRFDRAKAIEFIDATDRDTSCPVDRADLLARFHAREDGVLLSGAAAFAAMWRAIPILRPLGLIARQRWVLGLLERAYRAFLRVRPRLQRVIARRLSA